MRSVLLAAVLVSAAAAAQTTKPSLTAAEIIDKSIEATGGRAAMEKLSSTYAKGTMEFTSQEAHGVMEFYAKAPNKQLIVMNLESVGEIKQAFDGQVAWGQDPSGQVIEVTGAPLDDMKQNAVFNAALKWRDLFPKVELTGEDTVGGRKAFVIRLTNEKGKVITRYYDTETFLLLRESGNRETPQGPMDIKADFSDYREVNGIKAPFVVKQSLPMGEIVLKISEMKNNVEIDDAKFTKPADKADKK
jgi:outer membrane lipoprotein-sorting protein